MSNVSGPCSVADCENPAARQTPYGPMCDAHRKRLQPSRAGSETPVFAPLKPRPKSPWERLTEACLSYANAETDEEFNRARDGLQKAVEALRRVKATELLQQAYQAYLRRGGRVGPPTKYPPDYVAQLVQEKGSVSAVAKELRISHMSVRRYLAKTRQAPTKLRRNL